MANILVTGGGGFLGSHLCEKLLEAKHYVKVLDMNDGSKVEHLWEHERFHFIRDSILNEHALSSEMKDIDMVFHFAAVADPKKYVVDPLGTLNIDLQGTLNVLKLASENKLKVMFASTSEIYGKNPNIPWSETCNRVLGPTNINRWCYSTSKAASEHYCFAYAKQKGMKFVILRFFNVYGPRLDDLGSGRVIPIFLKQFITKKSISIHGDGTQTRTFLYIDDAIEAIVKLAFTKEAEGQVFNVGSSAEISILELAKVIQKVGNFQSKFVFISYQDAFGDSYEDIPRRVPDIRKIKEYIGWESTTSLDEGLKKTIDYYLNKK